MKLDTSNPSAAVRCRKSENAISQNKTTPRKILFCKSFVKGITFTNCLFCWENTDFECDGDSV